MNKIITYQDYLDNGGFVIPELNSYDQDNQINTIEEKFNKFLIYTQIQLNYVLQDKLEGVEYNLLNIDEPYRRDIINILIIRLNRAFENDRLIPRDENTQYSEMGAINWSSMSDIRNEAWGFWNEQELNIIETSGLRSVVSLWCQDYEGGQYPVNLTNDMANRLMSDDSLEINTKVNPSNGLTALELKASEKIARKEELKQKLDVKQAEKEYAKKSEIPHEAISQLQKEKVNKKTFNDLSEAIVSESNRHQLLISKFNLVYTDVNQRKEWTFPNKNLYDKVKKFKDSFEEQVNWDDSNFKVSYIWIENHDFEMKCFSILEDKFFDAIDFSAFVTDKQLNYEVIKNDYEYASLSDVLKQWIWDKDVRWVGQINTGNHPNSNAPITIECLKSWKNKDTDIRANMIMNIFRDWSSISYGSEFYEKIEIPFNGLLANEGRFFGGSVISFKTNPLTWKVDTINTDYWRRLLYESKVFINLKERFK